MMLQTGIKWLAVFFFITAIIFSGCSLREREEKLRQKEAEIAGREQALLLKENALQLKEAELQKKGYQLDSTQKMLQADSIYFNPQILGTWSVTMNCTETTCPGSAVGDTKTEQWKVENEGTKIMARVIENGKLVRVYSGTFKENGLELTDQHTVSNLQPNTQMIVRLQPKEGDRWEGRREIIRTEECRILYALNMVKQ